MEDLELKVKISLKDGMTPLFVNATCGTTVLGAYDPVEPISDVCQKYGIWLHVDVSMSVQGVHNDFCRTSSQSLTLKAPNKNCSRRHLIFYCSLSKKIRLDFSCESSA